MSWETLYANRSSGASRKPDKDGIRLIILGLDTSEARGSVALLRDREPISSKRHEGNVDYSEWVLPTVDGLLGETHLRMKDVDLLAVSAGPGSFTGLRVGLTAVKAWAEVYRKPVVAVSRLEAMARSFQAGAGVVAAYCDAQRGQVFGGLYRRVAGRLSRIEDELVIAPEDFLEWVEQKAGSEAVSWVSLDPELVSALARWRERAERGDTMLRCEPELAIAIGRVAEERALAGEYSNALELDANYVRRSDAEIFWKGH